MLPPLPMLTIKNRDGSNLAERREKNPLTVVNGYGLLLALVLALAAGCTPAGPRALLDGKRLMEEGKNPQAIEKLKLATTLLGGTNALAWNYLGVAYQQAGELPEAEVAYKKALALNRDLDEVHFNLGCLWLEQNKLDAAKTEFTACTMRHPTAAEGFLQLGTVQLRTHEPLAAEKSFNEAMRLSPQSPEALNGLGLARLQRGRASEAVQCFQSALKLQPDYRPALLNLAIVSHQYLKDRPLALQKYREYLALKPTPPNAEILAATVRQLEQELNPPGRHVVTNVVAQPSPIVVAPKPVATNVTRLASAPKPELPPTPPKPIAAIVPKPAPVPAPKPPPTNAPKPAPIVEPTPAPAEVVRVVPQPVIRAAQDVMPPSAADPLITTSTVPNYAAAPKAPKRGFLQRVNPLNLFHGEEPSPANPTAPGTVIELPAHEAAKAPPAVSQPAGKTSPPSPTGPPSRYAYKSPAKFVAGNHAEAARLFTQGEEAQQSRLLPEAMQAYRSAAQMDPTFFEAYYNLGLVATAEGNLPLALTAYEDALTVRPRALDARYNFALVLKQSNYLVDAVNELERLLAIFPNDGRSHLALANLYAQQFRQPAKARQHYLRVLEVDPGNPQASAIHYWLAANPP